MARVAPRWHVRNSSDILSWDAARIGELYMRGPGLDQIPKTSARKSQKLKLSEEYGDILSKPEGVAG